MMARATAFALTLLLSAFSHAQSKIPTPNDPIGSFSIIVRTAQNAPAADARVELHNLATGQIAGSGYTNSVGALELMNIPMAPYEVVVTQGLSEVRERSDMHMGDRTMMLQLPAEDNGGVSGNQSSVSVAQFKVPGKARSELKKAQEALQKDKKDEATQHISKALEIYPAFAEALTLRAVLSMDRNESDAALNDLDAAIKADPSCSIAYFAMGATYNVLSRFDDAIRVLNHGISISPNSWQAYFELGKAQVGKGDYQMGVRQLDKAQSLLAGSSYPSVHLVKAHALMGLKQFSEAMGELQAFLTEAPNDPRSANARQALDQVKAYMGK